jgi:hypothetical protein
MNEEVITVADRFRVAHVSRVSGFGVAPKRTFPLATLSLFGLLVFGLTVRQVREPEAGSPAREKRELSNFSQLAIGN